MLGLNDNELLLEALQPPDGMQVEAALGATFTLDLAALLSIPVASSFRDIQAGEEPAGLLESIRRHAERTVLLCQAGAISVPRYREALTFVERTVVEVAKPVVGLVHPKVWALRFTGPSGTAHRVLVMSRNLTFDRARDVIVRLDEDPEADAHVDARPLVDYLRDLLDTRVRDLTSRQSTMVDGLLSSLRTAPLAVPSPFATGEFVPLRPDGRTDLFVPSCDQALAISPFITGPASSMFVSTASRWSGVVSRPAALDASASHLRDVDTFRLRDQVLDAEDAAAGWNSADEDQASVTRGLHAKVFVQDVGRSSTVLIGSANLTDAAAANNWELMVRLTGARADVGCGTLITRDGAGDLVAKRGRLSFLLQPHELPDLDAPEDPDLSEVEQAAYNIASSRFVLHVTEEEGAFSAHLEVTPFVPPPDTTVRARLLSQKDWMEVSAGEATWAQLALHDITPFLALEVTVPQATKQVLVRADLTGVDEEKRRSAVIAHAIRSRDDFMRFIASLYGGAVGQLPSGEGDGATPWTGASMGAGGAAPVLESLLAAASRHPDRLSTLQQTMDALLADPTTKDHVPEEFLALWPAIHAALPKKATSR